MFALFVCALLGFRARKFPAKPEKNPGTFFAEWTLYSSSSNIENMSLIYSTAYLSTEVTLY